MSKTTLRKAAYAVILCLIALITVFYARGDFDIAFIKRPAPEKVIPAEPDKPEPADTETAPPSPETEPEPEETEPAPAPKDPTYDEVIASFADTSAHADKHVTNTPYNAETHILARTGTGLTLPAELSLRDVPTRKLVTEKNGKGSNVTTETTENAPQAAVRLYFGYILIDNGTQIALCDKSGRVLVSDVSAYKLVGYCDLAGHPLFNKDGKYYYYYDGKNILPGTIVLDTITPETYAEYQNVPEPTGLPLVAEKKYTEVTPTISAGAGMTECTVDENYFNKVAGNSSYYNRVSDIFRLCETRRTRVITNQTEIDAANAAIAEREAKLAAGGDPNTLPPVLPVEPVYEVTGENTFWWYVKADGNTAFNNYFIEAFDFTEDGAAFIVADEEDVPDKLTVIDPTGDVLFRASNKNYYFAENGAAKVWDGHYLPDTLGVENTGKLTFSGGFAAVRRKLLDTSNGRVFISDKTELVNTRGELFNLPKGYTLEAYSDSRLLVSKNGKYGYMKTTGEWLTGMDFEYAEAFREGLASVCKNGKFGVIDVNGSTVIPFVFDHISSCSDGVIAAWEKGHGWTVFCKMTAQTEPAAQVNPVLSLKRRAIAKEVYEYAEKQTAPAPTNAAG